MTLLPERQCWRALRRHHEDVKDLHLRELFAADPGRGEQLVAEGAGLYLDYSKNRITAETIRLLLALAEPSDRAIGRGDHSMIPRVDRAIAGDC